MKMYTSVTNRWRYYSVGALICLLYVGFTFFAPPSKNTFGLGQEQILLLKFTITLPYIATWILALYGLSTLGQYLSLAKEKNDILIPLLRSVRTGLFWIFISTVGVAITGAIKAYIMAHKGILPISTIVTNYIYVFPVLIGFIIIYRGVRALHASLEIAEHKHVGYIVTTIIVLMISVFYLFLVFTNPTRQFSSDSTIPATYYLPDILTILTIVIPILITWWLGFSSAFILSDLIPYFTRPNLLRGITQILYGIWSIIFTSITIQGLLSLGNTRLYSINLGVLLVIIYLFIVLQGLGYLFVALGSNTLRKLLNESTNTTP